MKLADFNNICQDKRIILDSKFNQELTDDDREYLSKFSEIRFGDEFNYPLNGFKDKDFVFGRNSKFNQKLPIEETNYYFFEDSKLLNEYSMGFYSKKTFVLKKELDRKLTDKDKYFLTQFKRISCKSLLNMEFHNNIEELEIGSYKELDLTNLPSSLRKLKVKCGVCNLDFLPAGLKELDVEMTENMQDLTNLPDSLVKLKIYIFVDTPLSLLIPKSLKYLEIYECGECNLIGDGENLEEVKISKFSECNHQLKCKIVSPVNIKLFIPKLVNNYGEYLNNTYVNFDFEHNYLFEDDKENGDKIIEEMEIVENSIQNALKKSKYISNYQYDSFRRNNEINIYADVDYYSSISDIWNEICSFECQINDEIWKLDFDNIEFDEQ